MFTSESLLMNFEELKRSFIVYKKKILVKKILRLSTSF